MGPVLLLESEHDPSSDRQRQVFGMDEAIQTQLARLTSDVQHIETDVADIKVDVRRIDGRLNSIDERVHQLDTRVYQVEQRLSEKIDGVRSDLTEKMNDGFTAVRSEMASIKVWALGLYIALAGTLLFVVAKALKWL
jgi:predicted nuclease with TOPRIM domain